MADAPRQADVGSPAYVLIVSTRYSLEAQRRQQELEREILHIDGILEGTVRDAYTSATPLASHLAGSNIVSSEGYLTKGLPESFPGLPRIVATLDMNEQVFNLAALVERLRSTAKTATADSMELPKERLVSLTYQPNDGEHNRPVKKYLTNHGTNLKVLEF
jgi:hypothetical protein